MAEKSTIYKNVLENMSDGVMTIDLNGRIMTFNQASERILGLATDDVLGKRFGEVFLLHEGSDELNQTILDAVYEAATIYNKVVTYRRGEESLFLSVTTSYLKAPEQAEKAIIVVINDITETRKLEAEQQQLADELKAKHRELQDAYLGIEESNKNLQTALKKVHFVRIFAGGFILLFFIAMGLFYWESKPSTKVSRAAEPKGKDGKVANLYTVAPRMISSTISLTGELRPLNTVHVNSPFAGIVQEVYFQYGQMVEKGQPLLKLDTDEVAIKAREAESAYIKALEKAREVEAWDKGNEVSEAKRNLAKARIELDAQRQNAEETERLYKKGIVPGSEYESSKRQYANAKMSYESSEQSLKTVVAKGSGDNLKIAKLELANAQLKLGELRRQVGQALVRAPASGTIILPELSGAADKDKKAKQMGKGVSVTQGETLVSIGDVGSLCVKTKVDEMSVMSIKKGQKVRITGDAFPGITLDALVHHVSSQAVKGEGGKDVASFEVTTLIEKIKPEDRTKLLLGMSTNLSIITYEKPDALLVPVAAVRPELDGHYVVVKQGEQRKKVKVDPGQTTLDSVEIKAGLKPGDVIEF